ncbi:hypothetical protein UJ101_01552 [Flavobacteriaceae bacterium UJ101]|nr:hypothetical protein UJ101_01552 [Flavobacteriaceae bacterium UJ101]
MKNIILIGVIVLSNVMLSQVAIGKTSVDGDGLLDFASGTTKGIVLPKVTTLTPQVGSLVFDAVDKKVKLYNGEWIDLSINEGAVDTSDQDPYSEEGGTMIIGSETTSATGVLVLESTTKALILPKIASPHLNVKNPSPGMICYDTDKDLLAVYNGLEWAFWRK